jgi:hypothetical protein
MVTSPYNIGAWDIRWDNPKIIPQNNGLHILGCNVYRSTDTPYGPYVKCNANPVTVLFYRDETQEKQVTENVTATLHSTLQDGLGVNDPSGMWTVSTTRKPIIVPDTNGKTTNDIKDVRVEIDNGDGIWLEMPAYKVDGFTGQIQLISWPIFSQEVQQIIPPRLPYPPNGKVRVTYRYVDNQVLTVLSQRIFYKVTTLAVDPKDASKTIETPICEISERSGFDIEMLDYIWKEAIRRNRWILEQGGERVKIFIRKWLGPKCDSFDPLYGQSHNNCEICYGSNIIGGYSGPYDAIVAPPEADKQIELMDMGLHIRYEWASWLTDWPLIQTRDIIVRQNNERYSVGPVNPQGQRGAIFQQHFTMSLLDQGDIRYKIPITGSEDGVPVSYDPFRETAPSPASPAINAKPEVPQERIIRGRTVVFENIQWIFIIGIVTYASLNNIFSILC